MGFLDKLADWLAPSMPPPPPPPAAARVPVQQLPPVPAELPRIPAKTAAEICKECEPEPGALQLLTPQQTPAQFLAVLQGRHLGADMVKVLAHGMPDRAGVAWTVQCVLKVADKLPATEVQAMQAAQAWVKSPTSELQQAAATAAARTELQGPGGWAAQAAAWAKSGPSVPDSDLEGQVKLPRLTPQAVNAAVLLSATILARPEYAVRNLAVPQMPAVPDVFVPQMPGAAGQLYAEAVAALSAGGAGALGLDVPALGGAMPVLSALAANANLSTRTPPSIQVPEVAIPGQRESPQITVPQVTPPSMPPAVLEFMFKEQQPFIAIGLDLASGKTPVA